MQSTGGNVHTKRKKSIKKYSPAYNDNKNLADMDHLTKPYHTGSSLVAKVKIGESVTF